MDPTTHPKRRIGLGVIAGATIAALILGSGLFWVFTRSHNWSAKATAVVLPAPNIPSGAAASYYDTLSRGQIVETYAEILRLKKFQDATTTGLNLTTPQAQHTTVTVSVVPNTALITITAAATSGTVAEALADGVFTQASEYVRSLSTPYIVNSVSAAKGTATQSTSHTGGFLAVLLVVALVVGIGVQQAVSQLVITRAKSVSPPAQPPAPGIVPAVPPATFASPPATFAGPPAPAAAPEQPAPPVVRPKVPTGRPRPRWPANPEDAGSPEPPTNGSAEPTGNGSAEPAGKKGSAQPAGKGSAPAGKGSAEPGRVEERIPEP